MDRVRIGVIGVSNIRFLVTHGQVEMTPSSEIFIIVQGDRRKLLSAGNKFTLQSSN